MDALTYKFAAPEVTSYDPRGPASDVFSLGCVFLEMLTVLSGSTKQELDGFWSDNESHSRSYAMNLGKLPAWLEILRSKERAPRLVESVSTWCSQMLLADPRMRPRARALLDYIVDEHKREVEISGTRFIGKCYNVSAGG